MSYVLTFLLLLRCGKVDGRIGFFQMVAVRVLDALVSASLSLLAWSPIGTIEAFPRTVGGTAGLPRGKECFMSLRCVPPALAVSCGVSAFVSAACCAVALLSLTPGSQAGALVIGLGRTG